MEIAMTIFKRARLLAGMTVAALTLAGAAGANTITFGLLTDNGNDDLSGQLRVEVTAGAGGTVDFTFYNDVGIASSITDIYFDDGTLLELATITDFDGASL